MDKHLLLTRYDLGARRVAARCSRPTTCWRSSRSPLLGIIPESEEVLRASNVGTPVTLIATG